MRGRVAAAILVGGGVAAMVQKTGIPLGTLNKYAAKTSTASFTNAAKIAAAAEIPLDQIAFGKGELIASSESFVRLPEFSDVRASAGFGAVPVSEVAEGVIAFERQFLRDLGAMPEKCSVIWARGTSMKPTIPDGAMLIVDHSQKSVENGCIYVFNVAGRLLVKRARWRLDGRLELVSDNKDEDYPVETIGADSADQLRVVGRVVYFCRRP